MSESIRFPSEEFPSWPAIALALPEHWSGVQVASTLMAARRAVPEGQFMSNVIVRAQRVGGDVDLEAAAKVVDDGVAQLEEVEHIGRWLIETDGRQAYAREFAYRNPQVGTVGQAWRIFVVEHDGVVDLVELVGTVSAARTGDLAEVRAIMDSVEIRDAVPAGRI
jgi:hypothetical protein